MHILIRPTSEHALFDFHEWWRFRSLFYILVWRTLKVRYRQTAIGVAWAILQPLLLTVVFTIIFGRLAAVPSDGIPYPIFVLSGLLVWLFVSQSLQQATTSIVLNAHLVGRIYFPRVVLLIVAIAAAFFDFICAFALMICAMVWYGSAPSLGILAFVPVLFMAAACVLGMALWLSALHVRYRDVGHILPFLVQLWMFTSPIIYPTTLLPERFRFIYGVNPLVVVIDTSRWAFAGGAAPELAMVLMSASITCVFLVSGLWYFKRHEGTFADIV